MEQSTRIEQLCDTLEPLPTDIEPRLKPIEGVRAVLFDVYGTLLISGSGDVGTAAAMESSAAFEAALESAGLVPLQDGIGDEGVEIFMDCVEKRKEESLRSGRSVPEVDIRTVWRDVLSLLADRKWIEWEGRDGIVEHLGVEYECRVNPVWPMPGAESCLRALKGRGMPLGIVSNAQFYTPLILDSLLDGFPDGLGLDPNLIVWSYELLESKPSTAIFATPLKVLKDTRGILLEEIVYVGNDMLNDVWTASQLGLRTILFAGDRRSLRLRKDDQRCQSLDPDTVVVDLAQIPECLL